MDQKASTSTAATQQTEPEVVAAISSADGQVDGEQAIRQRAYAIWEEAGTRVATSIIGYALKPK